MKAPPFGSLSSSSPWPRRKSQKFRPPELQTDTGQLITITGRHFARQIKAQLIDPDGKKSQLQIRSVTITRLQIFVPPLAYAGRYKILLMNSAKLVTTADKALLVRYPVPVFGSLQPATIRLGVDEAKFSVQADKLVSTAHVVVIPHGADPRQAVDELSVTATVGARGIQASLDPATAAGDYDVYVVNHSAEAPVLVGTLSLLPAPAPTPPPHPAVLPPATAETGPVSPIPAPAAPPAVANVQPVRPTETPQTEAMHHTLLIGLGWEYGLPMTEWGSIYGATPESVFLNVDYFLTPFDRPVSGSSLACALGLDSRYMGFSSAGGSSFVSSSLTGFTLAVDPSATWSLPFMSIRARVGGGLAYSSLDAASSTGGSNSTTRSLDLLVMSELSFEFPLAAHIRLGISADYEHFFYSVQGMDLLGASTYAALNF